MTIAGIGGGARHGAAALADAGRLVGVCAQERVTRVRAAGVNASGMPDEALEVLLQRLGRTREAIDRYVVAREGGQGGGAVGDHIGHHFAHACTAYFTSSFSSATVVVCDHDSPEVTVWVGEGETLRQLEWAWDGPGFATVLSRFGVALGLAPAAADQGFEALARLRPDGRDSALDALVRRGDGGLHVDPSLEQFLAARVGRHDGGGESGRAVLAASLQARVGDLLVDFLREVHARAGIPRLCVGGTLFHRSSMNTRVKLAGVFEQVHVPVDPGDSGLAVGAALHGMGKAPASVSPFLGPEYASEETKQVLDNCKLQYSWESEEGAAIAAVKALQEGRLVGWFDGPMEWGQRSLGARCILANPRAPYVLENLNRFLKRRESWQGYALSGVAEAVPEHFSGPASAPFMECDFRPRDPERFREALPSSGAAVRVHTVPADAGRPRFRRLLEAFGEATGLPFLINTSFNVFHEPIVCSPRDAVRVFYGSGLDMLVMNQFLLRK